VRLAPRRRTDMSSIVVFTRRGGDTYTVRFRYDPTFVDLIKTAVPPYARSWDCQFRLRPRPFSLSWTPATVLHTRGGLQ
jgi:hypothetical protein